MRSNPRSIRHALAVLAPLILAACPLPVIVGDNPQDTATTSATGTATATGGSTTDKPTSGSATDPGPPDEPTPGQEPGPRVVITAISGVDILFVIDNSSSMAGTQARLSQAIGTFVDTLADRNVRYRIGITTTDAGNPNCAPGDTTPERGALVLSSCLDRLDEFTLAPDGGDFSSACTDFCTLTDTELEMKPTETHLSDGVKAPRKWVEVGGEDNLPDGVDPVDALRCFLPQGVSGCGFPSHLESMFLALKQASDPGSPTNAGFMRRSANLSVIFVSDKTDCSFVPAFQDIFTDNKVFWEDPNAPAATLATCWNAGVTCDGPGPQWNVCLPDNKSSAGQPDVSDELAVLQPMSKYLDFIQAIEEHKQTTNISLEARLAGFTGVPLGYETHDADLLYEESPDPELQSTFGIGPGCVDGERVAVPPVRERQFIQSFAAGDSRDLYSICADDFGPALAAIAEKAGDGLRPGCMPNCVLDTDPNTPIVEPSCTVFELDVDAQTEAEIPPCDLVDDAWTAPPGSKVCYAPLVDAVGHTPSTLDDMSPECAADGYNLEFYILRMGPVPDGAMIEAACAFSLDKAKDCPNL